MKQVLTVSILLAVFVFLLVLPQHCLAADDGYIKWYGVGGELTGPKRWFGRIGISEYLGAEVIFAMRHFSDNCGKGHGDCDSTALDIGAGIIYDIAPSVRISPYLAGRFILTMTGDGDSETSGTVETAGGVEYVIMKRLGVSGELNFSFHTDPTQVVTSSIVRFYFYF